VAGLTASSSVVALQREYRPWQGGTKQEESEDASKEPGWTTRWVTRCKDREAKAAKGAKEGRHSKHRDARPSQEAKRRRCSKLIMDALICHPLSQPTPFYGILPTP
jgi:hypothetical protein